MATKKAAPEAKKPGTAMVSWEEKMAKEAELAAGMEASTGGGQMFGLKGGQLTWQDAPLPNNQMAVVIADSILQNVFYTGKYDPDTPASPICYAFGRDEKTMGPPKEVHDNGTAQATLCKDCEMNTWNSADVGKGKACKNSRRLALVGAGNFDKDGNVFSLNDDPQHMASSMMGFMNLPVTSTKGYASFVKQVAGALKRPPFGIVTKIKVVPDSKTQFKVTFEPIMPVPNNLMEAVVARNEEAKNLIEFPYQLEGEEEEAKPAAKTKKPTVASKVKRKY